MVEEAAKIILSETGVIGAVAVILVWVCWRLDKEVRALNARLLDESIRYRQEMLEMKDAEMARQMKQLSDYQEFERTIEEFGKILERVLDRKGRN